MRGTGANSPPTGGVRRSDRARGLAEPAGSHLPSGRASEPSGSAIEVSESHDGAGLKLYLIPALVLALLVVVAGALWQIDRTGGRPLFILLVGLLGSLVVSG